MSDTMLMFVGEELYTISAASRLKEAVRFAPAAATVLGPEEIKRYRTLGEALKSVPGFYLEHNGIKERIYLRGVANSFLLMIDGVPMANDSSTEGYPRGLELSLDYIQKIEIIRGPGSSLWGADAFSGVVNLITKKGSDLKKTYLKTEGGSFDTRKIKAMSGYKIKNVDMLLFASTTKSKNFEEEPEDKDRKHDHYNEFFAKFILFDSLTISGRVSDYGNYFNEQNNWEEGKEDSPFSFIQIDYNHELGNDLEFSLKTYFNYFDSSTKKDIQNPLISEIHFGQDNRRYGIDGKVDLKKFENHITTFGLSFEYNDASSTSLAIEGPPLDLNLPIISNFENTTYSMYFQDRWKPFKSLDLTFGIRLDKHEDYRRNFSPRFSLGFYPFNWLDIKTFYGKAYKSPNLYAKLYDYDFDPSEVENIETEITFWCPYNLNIKANYFYQVLDDLLEPNAMGRLSQVRRQVEKGIELSLNFFPLKELSFYLSYTALFGERQRNPQTFDKAVIPISNYYNIPPDHVLLIGSSYNFLKYYTLNLEVNYTDSRKIGENFYKEDGKLSPYWVFDLNLAATGLIKEHLDFNVKIRNLFDQKYKYRSGSFPLNDHFLFDAQERSVFVEMTYSF
jgi:iron complex outermembrane receptor protein